jgi:DNA polymerase/3'-5' exonuclease PolX
MSNVHVAQFLSQFSRWASEQIQIHGVALVGSYARGTATNASDVDLVLLAEDPQQYLQDRSWIHTFGRVVSQDTEHYGNLVSLRVHYEGGLEVEFGLTDPNWAAVPLDPGTSEVISAGMKVLFERGPVLSRHVQ